MTGTEPLALAIGPLVAYFFLLGLWQSGRSPRLVPGPLDFGLLAFGLGGLLAFGPVGRTMVGLLFRSPSPWAWLAWATFLALLALLWAPRTARRLVIYNVTPEALDEALHAALPPAFGPTLRGYEDPSGGRGLTVDLAPGWRTATIEAYGRHAEALIGLVESGLRRHLPDAPRPSRAAAAVWYALAGLTLVVPMLGALLNRSEVRAALRAILGRLQGG